MHSRLSLRFSLKQLLLATFMVAVIAALASPSFQTLRKQRIAVNAIQAAGGTVPPGFNSRFVFKDPALTPAITRNLIPHFQNVPISTDPMSPRTMGDHKCLVLDFTVTPQIDEVVVADLIQNIDCV